MNRSCVLALLMLCLGVAHSIDWDIVVGEEKRIDFYYNGTLTHSEEIPSAHCITSLVYDPVQNRVLFADVNYPKATSICSFDVATRKIETILMTEARGLQVIIEYDPVTQLLFLIDSNTRIYKHSLKPALADEAVERELLVASKWYCYDLAVDSCGGFIYWITNHATERSRFDGSERETIVQGHVFHGGNLAIDQKTQKIYWTDEVYTRYGFQLTLQSADFNGNDKRALYFVDRESHANSMAVSKDFIYWRGADQKGVWKLSKIGNNERAVHLPIAHRECLWCQAIAAKYSIEEQTEGIDKCEALKNLI